MNAERDATPSSRARPRPHTRPRAFVCIDMRRAKVAIARAFVLGVLAFALSEITPSEGIKANDVGVKDWSRSNVGDALRCAFDIDVTHGQRAIVIAREGASAIDVRDDGRERWRSIAGEVGEARGATATRATVVVALGASGTTTRAIDRVTGEVRWERTIYVNSVDDVETRNVRETREEGVDVAAFALASEREEDVVATLSVGIVVLRDLRLGDERWVVDLNRDSSANWRKVVKNEGEVVVIGDESGAACAAAVRASDGATLGVRCAKAGEDALGDGQRFVIANGKKLRAIAVGVKGKLVSIDVGALARGRDETTATAISQDVLHALERPSDGVTLEPMDGADARGSAAAMRHGAAIARAGAACALVRFNVDSGALELVKAYADSCPTFSPVTFDGKDVFVGVVRARETGKRGVRAYALSVVSMLDGSEIDLGETSRGDEFLRSAPLMRAFLSPSKDAMILVDADATMSLVRGGVVAWTREEASSQARVAIFGHLPALGAAHVGSSVRLSTRERVDYHVLSAKARFKSVTPMELTRLAALRLKDSSKNEPYADHNGFRRSIITLSSRGALVSMHNGDGRTLWRHYLGANELEFSGLMEWMPVGGSPDIRYALVVAKGETSTVLIVINQFTGEECGERVEYPFRTAHILPFDVASEGAKGLVLVDSFGKGAVYPKIDVAWSSAREQLRYISYYKVDKDAREIRGYKFHPLPATPGSEMSALHTWTVAFPPEAGEIVGFASKPVEGESVNSWVRVTGDRSTLFKYLNPNIIFVATSTENVVHVNLIDAVTGSILYRVRHGDARGPVHAVMCENWVVYHYFNTRAQRYAMSVLEMYDDSEERRGLAVVDLVYKSIFGGARNVTWSSLAPPALRIIGQSYYIRPEAKMLSVTRSMRGITEPTVLLATASDQVISIDKRFLDPRRPLKSTPADREEGLIPYTEVIPIIPGSWITHGTTVRGLRGIITAPAALESGVLFFAYGLDAFYARLAPSSSFDALDDDFSHALLVITLLALIIAVFIAKRAADNAEDARARR